MDRQVKACVDNFAQRKNRQQCNDVSKPLVKGSLVRRGWICVVWPQAVDERVCGFVSDDLMREAREYLTFVTRIVAEEERPIVLGVIRVQISECMRSHCQLMAEKAPTNAPSERALEPRQHAHHNGVHITRMKSPILFNISWRS